MKRFLTSLAALSFVTGFLAGPLGAQVDEPAVTQAEYAAFSTQVGKAQKRTLKRLRKALHRNLKKEYPQATLSRAKDAGKLRLCLEMGECPLPAGLVQVVWSSEDSILKATLSPRGVTDVSLTTGRELKAFQTLGRLRFDETAVCGDESMAIDGQPFSCALLKEKGVLLDPGAHVLKGLSDGDSANDSAQAFLIKAQETTILGLVPLVLAEAAEPPADAAPAEDVDKKRTLRLAVYDFEPGDIDPAVHKIFQAALVTELRKRQWLSVVSTSEIRAMLKHEADKQLLGCSDDTSCMSEIADALGVDALLVGSMAKVGESNVLTLKRISQREALVKVSVQRNVPADKGHGLLAEVGGVVDELFPEHSLRPGAERGAAPLFSDRLSPPPLPKWVFYTASGVTTLAAFATGATAGALFINDNTRTTVDEIPENAFGADEGQEFREIKSEVEAGENTNRTLLIGTTVAVGVTLTAAISAGIFALLTDFDEEPDLDLDD